MNWKAISKLLLVAAIGFGVYAMWDTIGCWTGKADEAGFDDLADDGEAHDFMYGRNTADEDESGRNRVRGGTGDQGGQCLAAYPPMDEPWKPAAAGGCFVGFLLFNWMGNREWRKRMTGTHRRV